MGEAPVCKNGRHYHPETGEKAAFATEGDAVTETFEALRIVSQELWDAIQAELDKRRETAIASGNPNTARRSKHLLTGLMVCGHCGKPYGKVGRARSGCREKRKGACTNVVTTRQDRIEQQVFDRLRATLLGPDLIDAFATAYRAELRVPGGNDVAATVKAASDPLARMRKARGGITSAIENGADFGDYSERDRLRRIVRRPTSRQSSRQRSRKWKRFSQTRISAVWGCGGIAQPSKSDTPDR